jgi:hypothetical protein
MLNGVLPRPMLVHRDDVKPVLVALSPVTEAPNRCHFRDDRLFPPVYRLKGTSAYDRTPGLDLYEGHRTTPAGNKVDVMATEFEAMGLDVPAAGDQIGYGRSLSPESSDLPEVFPFRRWDEASGAGHGRAYWSAV